MVEKDHPPATAGKSDGSAGQLPREAFARVRGGKLRGIHVGLFRLFQKDRCGPWVMVKVERPENSFPRSTWKNNLRQIAALNGSNCIVPRKIWASDNMQMTKMKEEKTKKILVP